MDAILEVFPGLFESLFFTAFIVIITLTAICGDQ